MRAWSPDSQGAASRALFYKVCGFFYPRAARGMVPFMAGRAGHPQGCAGSLTRSTNLHGLPPLLGRLGGRFTKPVVKEPAMADTALIPAIAPVLTVVDGIPTTTSADVARHFGKRHEHVMDSIRGLLAQLPENAHPNFRVSEYTDPTGRKLPAYTLTRDGFTLLAMGFTGKRALQFKLAYIDAFNRMEAALHQPSALPVDARAMLLTGPHELRAALPNEVKQAINRKAWDMAHEAYELCRQYLRQRVAYEAQTCQSPPRVIEAMALRLIDEASLGAALAPRQRKAIDDMRQDMRLYVALAERHIREIGQLTERAPTPTEHRSQK